MQLCLSYSLGASLKRLGFDVIAVDKLVSKSPKMMVAKLDLTQYATQMVVLDWIRLPRVKAVFVAPPCGTASRARNIQREDMPDLPQPSANWTNLMDWMTWKDMTLSEWSKQNPGDYNNLDSAKFLPLRWKCTTLHFCAMLLLKTSLLHYIAWMLSLQPHSPSLSRPGRLPTIKLAQPRYPPLCRSTKGNC